MASDVEKMPCGHDLTSLVYACGECRTAEVGRLTRERDEARRERNAERESWQPFAAEARAIRAERDALAARLGEAEGLLRSLTAGRMVCLSCWQDTDHHSPDCRLATFLTAGARDGGTQ